MQQKDTIIGIDLGTTNSVVAVMEGDTPRIIPNLEGNHVTPSVVAFPETGEVLVGEVARRQAVINPKRTVYSIKRFMGRRHREVEAEEKLVSYEVMGGTRGFARIKIGDREYSPPEISAIILQRLKEAAETHLGHTVSRAVITVPAYFNDAQRQATKNAGKIAGFIVERIVNEPTAAALAFGLDKTEGQKVAVVDFGGGTFDVSVLELGDGVFRVLSTNGDTHLGGDDFDKVLVNHVADEFQAAHGINLRQDPMALQRLLEASETAKRELSTATVTDITLPFITADQHGPKHLQTRIQRVQFEKLIGPLVERCCRPILKALEDAKVAPADIDQVVLAGGSTRVPRVVEMAQQMFNRKPHRGVNPDEAVAVGAAIQADLLCSESRGFVLLDVTPLSLGIETRGGFMTRLIERNTTIPTRHTEVFSTSEDNQTIVIVRVYQGEREVAADNRLLDEFYLEGVRPASQGVPQIQVTFDIDANSILHVSAEDLDTGQKQTVRIADSGGLTNEDIERLRRDAEEHASEDKQARLLGELRNYCESLCLEFESMLDHQADGVDQGLKTAVRKLIEHTRGLAAKDDVAVLRAGISELGRAGRDLSEAIRKVDAARHVAGVNAARGSGNAPPTGQAGGADSIEQNPDEIIDVEFKVKEL